LVVETYMTARLDEFDIKILNIVQCDNRLTTEQLAQRTGLSSSSVQRRLRRLRRDKIIESEMAVLSPEAVGRTLTAVIEVALERKHAETAVENFKRFVLATPEIMQCYYVTGQMDFILIVTFEDMRNYKLFLRRIAAHEKLYLKSVQTNIVVERVKTGLAVPIRAEVF
jgi:Lrp/AsnC family transcriptional regulator, leucine-responsive regulatory protein